MNYAQLENFILQNVFFYFWENLDSQWKKGKLCGFSYRGKTKPRKKNETFELNYEESEPDDRIGHKGVKNLLRNGMIYLDKIQIERGPRKEEMLSNKQNSEEEEERRLTVKTWEIETWSK